MGKGNRMKNFCLEPKSFAVEAETEKGKEFVTTKLTTRQTYTIAFVEGSLSPDPITFKEQDGMDFQAVTVKLPDGEYVPFLFSCKQLVAKGEGSAFKPGFTWGGEFEVPSYRTGGFLDPKGRGMYLGYDQAVALPGLQADGKEGQEELFKETNKVRRWEGCHPDGGQQGESGTWRDCWRVRVQAAGRHRHGRQGAEDHPPQGRLLWQGDLRALPMCSES